MKAYLVHTFTKKPYSLETEALIGFRNKEEAKLYRLKSKNFSHISIIDIIDIPEWKKEM